MRQDAGVVDDNSYDGNMTTRQVRAIVRLMEALTDRWRAVCEEHYTFDGYRSDDLGIALTDKNSEPSQAVRRFDEAAHRCDEATKRALETGLPAAFIAEVTGISIERVESLHR